MVQALSERNTFSIDLETTGLSPIDSRILLCQVSTKEKNFVMIPSKVDMTKLLPFLRDPKWLKIIQNAKFEQKFIQYVYSTKIENVFDTYLAELLINSESHNNKLEDLALKYAGVQLNKKIREEFFSTPISAFTEEQLQYAADDSAVLFPIYEAQKKLLKDFGLEKVADIEFSLAGVTADMENTGVPVDRDLWAKKLEAYAERHEESRLKMNSLIFDDTGIPEQMGLFVRDGIKLESPKKVKEAFLKLGIDIESTNEREISLIDHPAAQELLNFRELEKIKTSYGGSFLDAIHPFTGRIHADFQQIGTRTGRFSCKKPNLQQMPDEFRKCVTLKDHKIVVADFSNIELRILAELSGDAAFRAAFDSGDDPHKSTAATMFNIPIDKVNKEQRFIAKTINFGLAYGMGANKLRDILNSKKEPGEKRLTVGEVRSIYSKYKQAYKGAIDWLRVTGDTAFINLYSTTMLGRKRMFTRPAYAGDDQEFERLVGSIKRQGANSPIQGTNADITKLSMVNLHHDLTKYNYRAKMIIQVHDEIVILAHKTEAESIKELIVESMVSSAQEVLQHVPVKVDAHISDVWTKG